MKKTALLIFTLSISLAIFSQTKKVVGAPTTKPPIAAATKKVPTAKPAFVLKTATDSLSYAIGVLDGNFFKTQGLDKVSATALGQGFGDVMKGKTIFTPEQADQIVRSELQKNSRKKIQPVIDEGNKFLAENAKKPGVKKTASGLQYEVLVLGNGPKPSDTSVVKVHYSGFLLNGKPFDSSVERGEPATFPLGNVIRGWTEGVQLMPVGSKFKFYIPYQLGYGEQGSGEAIPGGSALIFEVELLEIVTNK
jgi:FKBP-type peptidyl-prolyl cis-trans isomerase